MSESAKARARPSRLPGDPDLASRRAAMIRVDHAGEFGATRIYAGQLAVLGDRHPMAGSIQHMAAQEAVHLKRFEQLLLARRVRPTLLHPLWDGAGYVLGAVTALIGPRAAMACTVAVETEIDRHYQAQRDALGTADLELSEAIGTFQAEEAEHRQLALAAGAENTPGYRLLSGVIRLGCRAAIRVAERL